MRPKGKNKDRRFIIMKKTLALILTAAMGMTALCACTDEPAETQVPDRQEQEQTQAAADFDPTITDDLQNLFDTGMESLVGVNYTPVLFMGVPADDPLGNTFLCTATVVAPDATPYWALVTMEDVGSEVTVTDIKTIDYAASSSAATVTFAADNGEQLLGGWTTVTDLAIPDAVANVGGHTFYEVLATQVVSGMNYSCLCLENGQWEIVTVYVNTSGEAEVLNTAALNI